MSELSRRKVDMSDSDTLLDGSSVAKSSNGSLAKWHLAYCGTAAVVPFALIIGYPFMYYKVKNHLNRSGQREKYNEDLVSYGRLGWPMWALDTSLNVFAFTAYFNGYFTLYPTLCWSIIGAASVGVYGLLALVTYKGYQWLKKI